MEHRVSRLFSCLGFTVLAAACASKPVTLARLAPVLADSLGPRDARPRVTAVTTAAGEKLVFDTAPAPRISGDTVFGSVKGASYVVPGAAIADVWLSRPGERPTPVTGSDLTRALAGPSRAPRAVSVGDRVRITVPGLGLQNADGSLQGIRNDTLLVRLDSEWFAGRSAPRPIPAGEVSHIEVRRGLVGHLMAQVTGMLAGTALGAIIVYSAQGSCERGLRGWGCAWGRVGRAGLGGAAAGVVGFLIGGALVPQRWEWVSPGGLHMAFSVQDGGGLGLGLSAAF